MKLFLIFLITFLTLEPTAFADPDNGSRVYGGYQLRITDAPWMAHLKYYFKENGLNWVSGCGGTIVNSMFILTAAHCATKEVSRALDVMFNHLSGASKEVSGALKTNIASQYEVRVGSSNKNQGGTIYKVARVFPHPNYDPVVKSHDVALLQLTTEITYNVGTVQNARLDSGEYRAGQKVSSMGWGDNPKNPGTPLLYRVDLSIIDIEKCARANRGGSVAEYKLHKICAIGANNADVCKGDSGGPLMFGHNNQQIGVVSYGANCPQLGLTTPSPGVYAKIADNMDWIDSVISGPKDEEDEEDEKNCSHQPLINIPSVEKVEEVD